MLDIGLTLAAGVIGIAVTLLILRGIELCVEHELRMLEKRSRDSEADRLGGQVQGLSVHEQGYDL